MELNRLAEFGQLGYYYCFVLHDFSRSPRLPWFPGLRYWSKPLLPSLCLLATLLPAAAVSATCASGIAAPYTAGGALADQKGYMGIRLRGSLRLHQVSCNGLPLTGLSALGWSADTGLLYALSDRGNIFHLRPQFAAGHLKNIDLVAAYPLRNAQDEPLSVEEGDSEGLAVINGADGTLGDEALLIAFERQPRIGRFSPHGLWQENLPLTRELRDIMQYTHFNRALESVVEHPVYGVLTAPERPLKAHDDGLFRIYDSNGVFTRFNPADYEYGSLTEMALTPTGDLMILERIFSGIFGVVAAVVHRLPLGEVSKDDLPDSQVIVRFDRDDGHLIDNFEGLTHHQNNHYFIVSDDNEHPLQQILLFYFEVLE